MRPDDLRGDARDAYDTWRRLGLNESAAMNALIEDGVVQLPQQDRLVKNFRETFGLSERAAEIAAAGRDGPPARPVSEVARSAAGPEPGDALRLVAKIEELAADLCRRGVSEEKALREAAFAVFEAAPDSLQDWVAQVMGRRWPGLWGRPASGGKGSSSGPMGGTVHG